MREETTGPGCRVCGAGLAVAERGRPPSYCSRGCQAKAYRQRKRDQALDRVARETREERDATRRRARGGGGRSPGPCGGSRRHTGSTR
ncbi:hypothetical protein NKH77_26020 [Streptomyces sp. M19]